MNKKRSALLMLLAVMLAAVGWVFMREAAATGGVKEDICHPNNGSVMWSHVNVSQESIHFEDDGTPKHMSHDGRVDTYSVNGLCPGEEPPETETPTPTEPTPTEPTETPCPSVASRGGHHDPCEPTPTEPTPTEPTPTEPTPTEPTPTEPTPTEPTPTEPTPTEPTPTEPTPTEPTPTETPTDDPTPTPVVFAFSDPTPPTCEEAGTFLQEAFPGVSITVDPPFDGAGTYTVTATLTDPVNTTFPDGTTAPKTRVITVEGALGFQSTDPEAPCFLAPSETPTPTDEPTPTETPTDEPTEPPSSGVGTPTSTAVTPAGVPTAVDAGLSSYETLPKTGGPPVKELSLLSLGLIIGGAMLYASSYARRRKH